MRILVILLLAFTITARAASTQATETDLEALAEKHIIESPDYWRSNATETGKCDGEKVAELLMKVAGLFKPVASLDEALEVLVRQRVLSSPDYWKKSAVPGGVCVGKNVAIVLSRGAALLPVDPPKSANAKPLEATTFEKLRDRYDVVIAGAGTGGVGAAVQAARMGVSVLLLEETDWIGGQAMAAAVTSMDEGGTLVRERGLYRELCGLISAHYRPLGINYLTAYWHGHVGVEPRVGRRLLQVMLGDARGGGVLDLALLTRVSKVSKEKNTVIGVDISSGGRTRHVASRVLIDATEWGDVIPLTGARYRVGNCLSDAIDPKRHVQSNTWTAVVKQYPQGVPDELLLKAKPPGYTDKVDAAFAKTLVAGEKVDTKTKPWNWATFIGYRGMPDSSHPADNSVITRTHLNYNNDYPSTVAELEDPAARLATNRAMQLKTLHLLYYIQHTLGKSDWSVADDEGFDSSYRCAEVDAWIAERPDLAPFRAVLIRFSIMPYVRESRRIVGLHTLRPSEIERVVGKPVQFKRTVALGDYPIDLHGSMSLPWLEPNLDREIDIPNKFGGHGAGPFAIPFECFIPEKVDGFLPAEKNLSQSRMANGATRLQPHTLNMGQAVGVIAALAVKEDIQPRAVDPVKVQRILLEAGDTLSIAPVAARHGTKAWCELQMQVLQKGAEAN
ncbi:FAD-dependent oxidoreductase [Prosthecobacter sp.]|uniref:FAD-dependent oxidoreductase n=1 Tax=Prosthecobacter sp. TaxID=1965333 RepID=UPI001D2F0004|nr:FAD-dependent oxidoreductase [Prosthecobacter sp.]MCB1277838.1 FAD-dependent oxidoreductase [Prosthecobacter sp.]